MCVNLTILGNTNNYFNAKRNNLTQNVINIFAA